MGTDTKDFVDFIKDSTENPSLAKELGILLCADKPDIDAIEEFFTRKGYTVSPDDCKKLIAAKNNVNKFVSGSVKY